MADPRRTLLSADDPASAKQVRETAYPYLLSVTELGAKAVGCTGISFMNLGMIIWLEELSELDPGATTALIKALAVIFDPKSSHAQKQAAERRRQKAVRRLYSAADLMMADPGGRG